MSVEKSLERKDENIEQNCWSCKRRKEREGEKEGQQKPLRRIREGWRSNEEEDCDASTKRLGEDDQAL